MSIHYMQNRHSDHRLSFSQWHISAFLFDRHPVSWQSGMKRCLTEGKDSMTRFVATMGNQGGWWRWRKDHLSNSGNCVMNLTTSTPCTYSTSSQDNAHLSLVKTAMTGSVMLPVMLSGRRHWCPTTLWRYDAVQTCTNVRKPVHLSTTLSM